MSSEWVSYELLPRGCPMNCCYEFSWVSYEFYPEWVSYELLSSLRVGVL